jgi:hypothetical protein
MWIDELMEKARVKTSAVRKPALSEERKKEIIDRTDKKVRAMSQEGYRPDYSRYANRMYKEEGGEKSIDERTCDLVKAKFDWRKDPYAHEFKDSKLTTGPGKGKPSGYWERSDKDGPSYPEGALRQTDMESIDRTPDKRTSEHKTETGKGEPKKISTTYNPEKGTAKRRVEVGEGKKKIYGEEEYTPSPSETKSIDERTCDLAKSGFYGTDELEKDRESRKQIADAVRAVRLHREGMHKEAKKIDPDPEKLSTAAWKHNAMIAASQREKSVLNTWQKSSSFVSKGSKILPTGPGGQVQDLVKDDEDEGAE